MIIAEAPDGKGAYRRVGSQSVFQDMLRNMPIIHEPPSQRRRELGIDEKPHQRMRETG